MLPSSAASVSVCAATPGPTLALPLTSAVAFTVSACTLNGQAATVSTAAARLKPNIYECLSVMNSFIK